MRIVSPEVFVLAYTQENPRNSGLPGVQEFLEALGCPPGSLDPRWYEQKVTGDILAEIAGRTCYKSFTPGLNPNVTKIREGTQEYIHNILKQKHGAVLAHVSATFAFVNVSRVFTHELVRHGVGTGISQESMRYVRTDSDMPMVLPEEFTEDEELMGRVEALMENVEDFAGWVSERFALNNPGTSFHTKKTITSAMRRLIPHGISTAMVWTANARALRHVIEMRTALGAEYEIREVFNTVGQYACNLWPHIMQDFRISEEGEWIPESSKV